MKSSYAYHLGLSLNTDDIVIIYNKKNGFKLVIENQNFLIGLAKWF